MSAAAVFLLVSALGWTEAEEVRWRVAEKRRRGRDLTVEEQLEALGELVRREQGDGSGAGRGSAVVELATVRMSAEMGRRRRVVEPTEKQLSYVESLLRSALADGWVLSSGDQLLALLVDGLELGAEPPMRELGAMERRDVSRLIDLLRAENARRGVGRGAQPRREGPNGGRSGPGSSARATRRRSWQSEEAEEERPQRRVRRVSPAG